MRPPFASPSDDDLPIDLEHFLHRLEHEPEFVREMQTSCKAALALPLNEDTAEIRKSAATGLKLLKHHLGTSEAVKLLLQARDLGYQMQADGVPRFVELKRLIAEATDHLLDAKEPDRTRLMAKIAEIREMIEKVAPGSCDAS